MGLQNYFIQIGRKEKNTGIIRQLNANKLIKKNPLEQKILSNFVKFYILEIL